jgi:Ser-tRNA(Ala) deacylase AlaX
MIIDYVTSVKSPEGKTPRYAHFEGYEWCGCGGTHVRSSGEIGQIHIRKIKMKDGKLRIGYTTERG